MADAPFPPGWHDVVRQHHADTAGYVVAQTGDCLELQAQERKHPRGRLRGRDFQPLPIASLATLRPPASWFLGIILCPGDDLDPILGWYVTLPTKDRDRVALFVHPRYAKDAVDEAWSRRGATAPQTVPLRGTWEHFHHVYGRLHGDRVYVDHAPPTVSYP